MKKLLISILAILLIVLVYLLMFKTVNAFKWQSKNFDDLKRTNNNLNSKINEAKQVINQDYPQAIESLESSVKKLKITKEKYEAKTKNLEENTELGVVNIKQYKIERLWATLGNYAKDCKVELVLDLVESNSMVMDENGAKLYDLNITLLGDYIGITDFIYDIEKDDTLNFKITDFKLVPNVLASVKTTNEESTTTTFRVEKELKATFRVENVGIELQ